MPMINLYFPVLGSALPVDHGYSLYAALSRLLPALHQPDAELLVGGVLGQPMGKGLLHLESGRSLLRFRLPAEKISMLLPLAGKALDVDGHRLRVGVPRVLPLIPAPALIARLVTIKTKERATDPDAFLAAARRQLRELGIRGGPAIPSIREGLRAGEPRRRVLQVRDKRVVGYSLEVTELTAEESIKLQENGLGGRGKMGCGFFVPITQRRVGS